MWTTIVCDLIYFACGIGVWICLCLVTDELVEMTCDYMLRNPRHWFRQRLRHIQNSDIDLIVSVTQRLWHFIDFGIVTLLLIYLWGRTS